MTRRKPGRDLPDVDDVLSGRVRATTAVYFALVHATNPTGLDLSARERDRRYTLKARLQSALIRDHHHFLAVRADPHDPRVVSLIHADLEGDAAHARVDALDEDARAWVRSGLDLAEDATTARPRGRKTPVPSAAREARPEAAAVGPAGALAAGQAALAEYDYDGARAHFEDALDDDDEQASVELLALLVDTLALDGDALALIPRLTERAQARPENRARLAVAHARLGDEAASLRWQRGLEGPWLAEALVALLARATDDGALERAAAHLATLEHRQLAHGELPALRARLAGLRAERRAVDEARIGAALDDEAAAERIAREVLAEWPDSALARTTVARIEARRRAAVAAERSAQADAAANAGDLERALALLAEARAQGAEVSEEWVELLRDELRAQRDQRATAAIARALDDADFEAAAHLYLVASPEVRQAAQQRAPEPRLRMLDALTAAWAGPPGRRATAWIAAVRARVAAEAALDEATSSAAQPGVDALQRGLDAALEILAPHLEVWSRTPEVSALLAQPRARIRALRTDAARATLAELEAAGARDDLPALKALLDALPADLDAAERARAEAWSRRLSLARAADAAERAPDWAAAREALEALIAEEGEHARAKHQDRLDRLDRAAEQALDLQCLDVHDLQLGLGDLGLQLHLRDPRVAWLSSEEEMVVPIAHGPWLYLAYVPSGAGPVSRLVRMRLRSSALPTVSIVDGVAVIVVGAEVVELRLSDVRLVRHHVVALPSHARVDRLLPVPRTGHFWVELADVRSPLQDGTWSVWSCERRRLERKLEWWPFAEVMTLPEPRVLVGFGELASHEPRGLRRYQWKAGRTTDYFHGATPHPDGRRLVTVDVPNSPGGTAELRVLDEGAPHGAGLPVPGPWWDRDFQLATSRRRGLVFLAFVSARKLMLAAFRPADGGGLEVEWQAEVTTVPVLVTDVDAHEVTALFQVDGAVHRRALGHAPPAPVPYPRGGRWYVPRSHACGLAPMNEAVVRWYFGEADDLLRQRVREATTIEALAELVGFALRLRRLDVVGELSRRLQAEQPHHPTTRLIAAEHAAAREDPAEVVRLMTLRGAGGTEHERHLHAVALMRLGRPADAARLLAREEAWEDGCALGAWRHVAEALEGAHPHSAITVLDDRITIADTAFAEGNPRAAFDVLYNPETLDHHELQSSMRLAQAALTMPHAGPRDALLREVVLAHAHGLLTGFRGWRELPLEGGRAWGAERVREIVREVEGVLGRGR